MICGIYKTTKKNTFNSIANTEWLDQTHTTAAGYGKCIRNELTTKQLGKFKLVYPPPLKLSSCCGPPTLGRALLCNLEFVSYANPILTGLSPCNLMMSWHRAMGSTWVARGDVLPLHTVELTNCGGVLIPSEAAVVVMQNISTGCWVGMTNGMWVGWSGGGWGIGGSWLGCLQW